MQKIVINSIHGAFDLSYIGYKYYADLAGITLYPYKLCWDASLANQFFKQITDEEALSTSQICLRMFTVDVATNIPVDSKLPSNPSGYFSVDSIRRDDINLIRTVEALGEKASSYMSRLKIVEIPDNIFWSIKEYDGKEWIAEKHLTWE